jgi:nucleotidyltransferase substrate binding protein (TIGR01987 family)
MPQGLTTRIAKPQPLEVRARAGILPRMGDDRDVRWRQRFENFEKAFLQWREALNDPRAAAYSDLEKQGTIQRFEMTMDLAWKTLKDFLVAEGADVVPATPRNTLATAAHAKIITDLEPWREMLDGRNVFSHAYRPVLFSQAMTTMKEKYLPLMEALHAFFRAR